MHTINYINFEDFLDSLKSLKNQEQIKMNRAFFCAHVNRFVKKTVEASFIDDDNVIHKFMIDFDFNKEKASKPFYDYAKLKISDCDIIILEALISDEGVCGLYPKELIPEIIKYFTKKED